MEHGEGEGRVKEHLRGVIARLAVDVHTAGEVRSPGVVQPVVVGEPCVRRRDGGEVRQAFLSCGIQAGEVRFPDFLHPRGGREEGFHFLPDGGIIDVNQGCLVVRYGKGPGGAAVQHFRAHFRFHGDPAPVPEEAVEGDAAGNVGNAVFAEDNGSDALLFQKADQVAQEAVHGLRRPCRLRGGRTEFLKIIVQVGQVDEAEAGAVLPFHPPGGVRYPPGGLDARHGPPEGREGEFPQVLFNGFPEFHGLGVNVKDFAAIRRVHGAGRHGPVRRGVHVVPPEELGAGEAGAEPLPQLFPEARPLHQLVGLLPELDFTHVPVVPSVGGNSVLLRGKPRDVGALRRAGKGRKGRREGGNAPPFRPGGEPGHVFHHLAGEGHHVNDGHAGAGEFHGGDISGLVREFHLSI